MKPTRAARRRLCSRPSRISLSALTCCLSIAARIRTLLSPALNPETVKMTKRLSAHALLRVSLALGVGSSVSLVHADTVAPDAQAVASDCVISKETAEQTALAAVGGGTVIVAKCEKDAYWHWSIDIRSKSHKYAVWISYANIVVKADLFPLQPTSFRPTDQSMDIRR
jgi:hypothetical protein